MQPLNLNMIQTWQARANLQLRDLDFDTTIKYTILVIYIVAEKKRI